MSLVKYGGLAGGSKQVHLAKKDETLCFIWTWVKIPATLYHQNGLGFVDVCQSLQMLSDYDPSPFGPWPFQEPIDWRYPPYKAYVRPM